MTPEEPNPMFKGFKGFPQQISKIMNDNPDSIEIGTPSKGGVIKCYGDFNKVEEFKKKIDNAISVRKYANAQIQVIIPG